MAANKGSASTSVSPEEILRTSAKLLAQAGSSRASTWSVRTLDRAYHWAALAERVSVQKSTGLDAPRAKLLVAAVENPCCSEAVLSEARARLEALPGINKEELERRAKTRSRLLEELEGALNDARAMGMSVDDVLALVLPSS